MAWPSGCRWISWLPDCHVFWYLLPSVSSLGAFRIAFVSPVPFLSPVLLSICILLWTHATVFVKEVLLGYKDWRRVIMWYPKQWFPAVALQIKQNINSVLLLLPWHIFILVFQWGPLCLPLTCPHTFPKSVLKSYTFANKTGQSP